MNKSKGSGGNVIIAVVALLVVAILGFAYLSQPAPSSQTQASTTGGTGEGSGGNLPSGGTITVQKAADTDSHRGTISLSLLSATGGTGSTSNVLFLDPSYAVYKDAAKTQFDALETRLTIMKQIADYGVPSLKSFSSPDSSPANNTATAGVWSETVTKKVGDTGIIYTSQGNSPTESQNASTVHLFRMDSFSQGTDVWTITLNGGGDKWKLGDYADYNFADNSYIARANYTVNDGGSQLPNQLWDFYTNSTTQGGDCYDCAIFAKAPTNLTGKFHSLTLSAVGLKPGYAGTTSEKFTTLRPASGVPEVAISYSILPAVSSAADQVYFIGFIPERFLTERSSSDKNRLSWEWNSDTYGADMTGVTLYIIQNAHSISTSNGAFQVTATFVPQYSNSASGYDTAP